MSLKAAVILANMLGAGCANKLEPATAHSEKSTASKPVVANSTPGSKADNPSTSKPESAQTDKTAKGAIHSAKPESTEGLILPDDNPGPSLGTKTQTPATQPAGIVGTTYCAKDDLKVTTTPQLAIKTADLKIYLIELTEGEFAKYFEMRKDRLQIRVTGTPYEKDGVLHLTAKDVSLVR